MDILSRVSCSGVNQEMISPRLIRSVGVEPQYLYANVENIIAVAQEAKAVGKSDLMTLPFCHTVEAKAMGADIRPADDIAGPRPGTYVCASLADLPEVEVARTPEVKRLLEACGSLSQAGERVAYQVSGPLSILNCLMELSLVFKTWRQAPESLKDICQKLCRMLLIYCQEICKAGASYIAYADPAGSPAILGPRFSKALTVQFTLPFLRELVADCGSKVMVSVCPLTVTSLVQAGAVNATVRGEGVMACACIKSLSKRLAKDIVFI